MHNLFSLPRAITLSAVAVALVNSASAQITATRIGDTLEDVTAYFESLGLPTDCTLGNLGPPVQSINPVAFPGAPHFAIAIYPRRDCVGCDDGFSVRAIHVIGEMLAADTVQPGVQFMESWNMTGCPHPRPEDDPPVCRSEFTGIAIEQAGFYDFSIPVVCECAWTYYRYFLSFFPGGIHRVLIDAAPSGCHDWVNIGFGLGWFDPEFSGDLLIYADTDCCEQPIPLDKTSWGTLKALFGP